MLITVGKRWNRIKFSHKCAIFLSHPQLTFPTSVTKYNPVSRENIILSLKAILVLLISLKNKHSP